MPDRADALSEAIRAMCLHLEAACADGPPSERRSTVEIICAARSIGMCALLNDRAIVRAGSPYLNRPVRSLDEVMAARSET